MKKIKLEVNGEIFDIEVECNYTLLQLLRNNLNLTGTKCGCERGECGACTVLMNGKAVNSCLVLACEADGSKILTIEGLQQKGKLDPIQESFINKGAIQCGFCTPGMVMATKELLNRNPNPTEEEIRKGLEGNICRCAGYKRIIEAVLDASKKVSDKYEKCE